MNATPHSRHPLLAQAPPLHPLGDVELPLPVRRSLPGGVPLYLIESGKEEVLRLDVMIAAGHWRQQHPMQAMLTNRMLREGVRGKSELKIACRLDDYGAWIELATAATTNYATLYCLKKHFGHVLPLLADMLSSPTFPLKNLRLLLKTQKGYYNVGSRRVKVVAGRYFNHLMLGDTHPGGRLIEPGDFDTFDPAWLRSFYQRCYHPCNYTLFLSGRVDDAAVAQLQQIFGDAGLLDAAAPAPALAPLPPPPLQVPGGRTFVPIEGAMQNALRMGCWCMSPAHPHYADFRFLTLLLGGYFGSRLMSNLREEKGYTYGVWAGLLPYEGCSQFVVATEAHPSCTEALIGEVYREIERLAAEPVPADELQRLRNYAAADFCRELEGPFAQAECFTSMLSTGQPMEAAAAYYRTIQNITGERINQLAQTWLCNKKMVEVVAGR